MLERVCGHVNVDGRIERVTRSYRGASGAERTRQRRAQLIEAGYELLGTEGLAATTMTAVCGRARLTERYFYESFANLDALLVAVLDDAAGTLEERVRTALEKAPAQPREKLRAALYAYVELTEQDPRIIRAMLVESLGNPALRARRHEHVRRFTGLVSAHAQLHYGDALGDARATIGSLLLVGGLSEVTMSLAAGELDTSWPEIVEAIVDEFDALANG
ncbi:TetR/AcrR family transcriptional regulator [Sciscionella sediminilitoris]|uniref:TetR/AcrR family transcriptional regulator n=1 Tax=Sciscionella sediminilitoris TaxID=1445613 RepID=UPI0009EB86C3|nr:TetR/AcrR family transcriptional regulator [Sciscionella sp. SE31]